MPAETTIQPPEEPSAVGQFLSNNKGGMLGTLLIGIVGMLVGGPLGLLIGGLIGALAGGLLGDKEESVFGHILNSIGNSNTPQTRGAGDVAAGEAAAATVEEAGGQSLAGSALGYADNALLAGWAASTRPGRAVLNRTIGNKGLWGGARWAATAAAPAAGWVTGTALPAAGGAISGAATATAAAIPGVTGVVAGTTVAGVTAAASFGVVVGTAAAYSIDRWVLNGGEGIESIYDEVDKAFRADKRNLNIAGAHAQMNRHMESYGGVRDPNGRFSLLIPENQRALTTAINTRVSELKADMEETAPAAWTRYLQFTRGQGERRVAYEEKKLELRSLESALVEMPDFIARQQERALALVREHEAIQQAMDSVGRDSNISNAEPAGTINVPQTPSVASNNRDNKPAVIGPDGMPVSNTGGADISNS